jgi:hypothetical protein
MGHNATPAPEHAQPPSAGEAQQPQQPGNKTPPQPQHGDETAPQSQPNDEKAPRPQADDEQAPKPQLGNEKGSSTKPIESYAIVPPRVVNVINGVAVQAAPGQDVIVEEEHYCGPITWLIACFCTPLICFCPVDKRRKVTYF